MAGGLPAWSLVVLVPVAGTVAADRWPTARHAVATWPDWHWFGFLDVPPLGEVFLVLALIALTAVRWTARRSPRGPLVLAEITDAAGEDAAQRAETRQPVIEAVLRDRLARGGVPAPGPLPGCTGAGPVVAAAPAIELEVRTGARVRSWSDPRGRRGWRVSGTLCPRDATGDLVLVVTVEHRPTGRVAFTDTVRARTPEDVAVSAAATVLSWRSGGTAGSSGGSAGRPWWVGGRRRTHRGPRAGSVCAHDEATQLSACGEFDRAVQVARAGLHADPTNTALRHLLGECQERLGQFEDALHTYASGQASFLAPVGSAGFLGPAGSTEPPWSDEPPSPGSSGRRPFPVPAVPGGSSRVRRGSPAADPWGTPAQALTWRYLVLLKSVDEWADRWIGELERCEARRRALGGYHGPDPWARPPGWAARSSLGRLRAPVQEAEDRDREERAKQLRGFLRERYRHLLTQEFPLLDAVWFAESHERSGEFPVRPWAGPDLDVPGVRSDGSPVARHPEDGSRGDDGGPCGDDGGDPDDRDGTSDAAAGPLPWLRVEELMAQSEDRLRDRSPRGRSSRTRFLRIGFPARGHRDTARGRSPAVLDLSAWVDELTWFFGTFLPGCVQDEAALSRLTLAPGCAPDSVEIVLAETLRRLGLLPLPGSFERVAESLRDPSAWRRLHLDRQLVGSVASWAAHHCLLLLDDGCRSGIDPRVRDRERVRLLRLSAQLDLRLFVHRALLDELGWPRSGGRRRSPVRAAVVLEELLRLLARFHYLDRLHRIAGDREIGYHEGVEDTDPGRLDPARDAWARLRTATAAEAGAVVRSWSRTRAFRRHPDGWAVRYAEACVYAAVIPDPAGPGSAGRRAEPSSDAAHDVSSPTAWPTLWKRRYDALAREAVQALDAAVRGAAGPGRHGRTLVEAGGRDWMLHGDPDLESLRAHPRFRGWASAVFGGDPYAGRPADRDLADGGTPPARTARIWDTAGVFGADHRSAARTRRRIEVHDRFLVEALARRVPEVVRRWRALECDLPVSSIPPRELLDRFARTRLDDRLAWESLALYPRFSSRPDLRAQAMERLDRLVGTTPEFALGGDLPPIGSSARWGRPLVVRHRLDELLERQLRAVTQDWSTLGTVLA